MLPSVSDLSGLDTEAETKCYHQYPTCLDSTQRLRKNVTICIRLVWTWNRGWDKMLPLVSDLSRLDTDAETKCCLEYATLLDSKQRLRQIGTIMIRLSGFDTEAETKCYPQYLTCLDLPKRLRPNVTINSRLVRTNVTFSSRHMCEWITYIIPHPGSLLEVDTPSKHKTFVWHLYNVGPTAKTLGRRCRPYKCYANVLCLLGGDLLKSYSGSGGGALLQVGAQKLIQAFQRKCILLHITPLVVSNLISAYKLSEIAYFKYQSIRYGRNLNTSSCYWTQLITLQRTCQNLVTQR